MAHRTVSIGYDGRGDRGRYDEQVRKNVHDEVGAGEVAGDEGSGGDLAGVADDGDGEERSGLLSRARIGFRFSWPSCFGLSCGNILSYWSLREWMSPRGSCLRMACNRDGPYFPCIALEDRVSGFVWTDAKELLGACKVLKHTKASRGRRARLQLDERNLQRLFQWSTSMATVMNTPRRITLALLREIL